MATWQERELSFTCDKGGAEVNNQFWNTWIDRTRLMRKWITDDIKSVADFGAGNMALQKMLIPEVVYYPIDYKSRCPKTIVCDFNKEQSQDLIR